MGAIVDEPAGDLRARRARCCAATGAGSDARQRQPTRWKYWAELRAGNITEDDWQEIEDGIARSPGHCMTMGTASTMTSAAEALGLDAAGRRVDPGARLAPRADGRRCTGKRIVEMVWEDLQAVATSLDARRRSTTRSPTVLALGGSTNAIVHLIAMARRAGVALDLDALRRARAPHAGARQRPAVGQVPDGGLLLRRRAARAARAASATCSTPTRAPSTARTLGENIAGARGLQRRRDPRRATTPLVATRRRSRCCAATSRPTAR